MLQLPRGLTFRKLTRNSNRIPLIVSRHQGLPTMAQHSVLMPESPLILPPFSMPGRITLRRSAHVQQKITHYACVLRVRGFL